MVPSQTGKFTDLIYNEFNLPVQIETTGGKTLKANYNGAGERILKEYSEGTWTYYIRDGGATLATIDESGDLNFNLIGMGTEGQLLGGVVDPVIDLTGTVSTESESNDTEGTADGPIGLSMLGSTSGNQEYDWYYFEVLRNGTVTITQARTTGEYETGEYDLSWTIFKNSSSVATGTGSGSFSVTPGTYYIRIDPLPITDYYDLYLSAQSSSEYATRYFLKDHLGSTRAIVDEVGTHLDSYDYYPFGLEMPGRVSTSSGQIDPYKYTGHERDEESGINLDYMLARGYDPAIGRFLQIDPLANEFAAWTPYHYVHNNPLNMIDPTGMAACPEDQPNCEESKNSNPGHKPVGKKYGQAVFTFFEGMVEAARPKKLGAGGGVSVPGTGKILKRELGVNGAFSIDREGDIDYTASVNLLFYTGTYSSEDGGELSDQYGDGGRFLIDPETGEISIKGPVGISHNPETGITTYSLSRGNNKGSYVTVSASYDHSENNETARDLFEKAKELLRNLFE